MLNTKPFLLIALLFHLPLIWFAQLEPKTLAIQPNKITKVQTVELKPETVAAVTPPKPKAKPAPAPPLPPKPKPAPKPKAQKKVQPKPKPKPKPKVSPAPQPEPEKKPSLSDHQKKQLEKLLTSTTAPSSTSAPLEKLHFSSTESYGKTLTEELKKRLILPEFGSVKIALTIDAQGNVTDIKVVGSESERNKKFILSKLKGIRLPKPPKGRDPQTFIVTLIGGI